MSTPSNQWYVEMSAGITLGPMPFDAVVELAETSAIMRDDRVREESSEDWRPAHEVSGLFGTAPSKVLTSNETSDSAVVPLSKFEVADTSPPEDLPGSAKADDAAVRDELSDQVEASDGVVRLDGFEVLLGESETSVRNADDPEMALLNAAANLETVDTEPAPSDSDSKISSQHSSERDGSEGTSNPELTDREPPKQDVPPPLSALSPPEEPPSIDDPSVSPVSNDEPVEYSEIEDDHSPPDLAALVSAGVEEESTSGRPVRAAVSPPVQTPIQPWSPPGDGNRQYVIAGGLAGLVLVGVWSVFSLLMPDIEAATYDQYAAIYQEYQSLSESPGTGNWTEFSTRAMSEIDETLPGLEAAAVPGERGKSLLLYAGRDLRSALELSPESTNPHAERLAGFFEQLNELHASRQ